MSALRTHLAIERSLCGEVVALSEGRASVLLATTPAMAADTQGLVHGGFVFGAADYAAMAAVNHPNVVLGSAETTFLKPSRVGEAIRLDAVVREAQGRRRRVEVLGAGPDGARVFEGIFVCFVLDEHVLGG